MTLFNIYQCPICSFMNSTTADFERTLKGIVQCPSCNNTMPSWQLEFIQGPSHDDPETAGFPMSDNEGDQT